MVDEGRYLSAESTFRRSLIAIRNLTGRASAVVPYCAAVESVFPTLGFAKMIQIYSTVTPGRPITASLMTSTSSLGDVMR